MKAYDQSRPQSAELLRLALQRLGEHPAAFSPHAYAVWYEHLAGINPRLSRQVEARLKSGQMLDDDAIAQLYSDHVCDIDPAAAERFTQQMNVLMNGLSAHAASTGESAGVVGGHLATLDQALGNGDPGSLASEVRQTMASTGRLRDSIGALQAQVASSRREIERLRGELDRTRDEAVLCALTGVLNRKGFEDRIRGLFDAPSGPPGSLCLVMFDIDHFKQVNDVHGHLIGDRVLEGTGQVLRAAVSDAGRAACAARYGGEEFAVLMPGCTVGEAMDLAEAVRGRMRAMRIRQRATDKPLQTITISAGVAVARVGDDATALVARADEALYRSKRNGRDRVTAA